MCAPHPSPAGTAIVSAGGNPTDLRLCSLPRSWRLPEHVQGLEQEPWHPLALLYQQGVCLLLKQPLVVAFKIRIDFLCAKLADLQGKQSQNIQACVKGQERVRT